MKLLPEVEAYLQEHKLKDLLGSLVTEMVAQLPEAAVAA